MNDINFASNKTFAPVFNFWREKSLSYRDGFTFGRPFPTQDQDISTLVSELDSKLGRKILDITNDNDPAIFMVVALGMAMLFEKYSGKQHIVFHSPLMAIGDDEEIVVHEERVPLLLNIEREESFKSLLSATRKNIRECYDNQNFPFSKADDDNADAFKSNVLIRFESIHAEFVNTDGYDLVVSIQKNDRGISIEFNYKTSVFGREFISDVAQHLSQLLRNSFANPTVPINQVGFLSTDEVSRLLAFGTGKLVSLEDASLHVLFEQQATKTPSAIAVEFGGRMLTYREVNEKANQLAHHLAGNLGVGAGDTVALMAERSERTIIGLLAILKSKAAFLPVDFSYPLERRKYLLEDANVKVLLTDSEHIFNIDYFVGEIFAMDVQMPFLETSTDNIEANHAGTDLCYVLYTSGSTGRPKGVEIEHRSIVNYITWVNSYYFNNTNGFTFGLFTSLSFDLTLTCIFSTLLRGDKLVVYPDGVEVSNVLKNMFDASSDVNAVKLTPSHVGLLSHLGISHSNVRVAILGGEALTAEQVRILHGLNPSMHVYNEYGPTETTVGCTIKRIDPGSEDITIGKPIDNARIYILDNDHNLVPRGVAGEICIGGVCVARGYKSKPDLTSERFIVDPFDKTGRVYLSGDLGMWAPDGELKYLGRKDSQVKIRGHRVEPVEIEKVLTEHDDVQDAHIFLDRSNDDVSMVAVITPSSKHTLLRKLLEVGNGRATNDLYELPNGMKVFHNNKSETDLIYAEIFDDLTYIKHGMTIKPGDVVFDVGANIGMFSLFVGLNFPEATVYSFEPMKPVYDVLKKNISLYNIDATPVNIGVSSADESAVFTYYPNSTVLSGRYGDLAEERRAVKSYIRGQADGSDLTNDEVDEILEDRIQSVQMDCTLKTISSVIKEHSIEKIDFLKIDVEKSELDVIFGIADKDWQKIKQIVIEVHDVDNKMRVICEILESQGFTMEVDQDEILGNDSIIYNIYARRKQDDGNSDEVASAFAPSLRNVLNIDTLAVNVKTWCEERLPAFMIPSSFVVVNTLPVNGNGKVDSQAIQDLIEQRKMAQNKLHVEPVSDIEKTLAGIYMSILKRERVGLNDDFFEMGGNSLKAIQVVSRIYKDLGLKTDLKSIFTYTTIGELAPTLHSTEKDDYSAIAPIGQRSSFAVSHGQKRIWLLSQLSDLSVAYNTPSAYVIKGDFNEDIFVSALNAIVDRHESLRTTFKMEEAELLQVIHQPGAMKIEARKFDFRHVTNIDDEISRVLNEDARHTFDLEKGPLLKLSIIRSTDSRYILSFNMHHIITDEWSKAILFKEVITLYEAYKEGRSVSLDPLRIQYKDYVQWQQEKLSGDKGKLLKDYWLTQLGGELPVLDLPTDHRRPATRSYRGGRSMISLNNRLIARIDDLTAECGVSKFMILLAAANVLFYKYSGQNDLIVGSPVSGRDHIDLESQVGFYVNTLALRNQIADNDTFDSFLDKVRNTTVEAYSHQAYPFDLLVDQVDKKRDTSRSPIFDVMVLFRSKEFTLSEIDKMSGLDIESYPSTLGVSKFDLTFVFVEGENNIELAIEYNSDLFDQVTIDTLAIHFQAIADRLLSDRQILLTDLEYLSEAERHEVTMLFNNTTVPYPRNSTMAELFEEQVLLQPTATAVSFEGKQVSYEELNTRANKAARFLRESYNIKPDDLVGLMVDRSVEMIVGMLAILKSGAGYVPIDPTYPAERVKYIISDANLKTVLIDDEEYRTKFNISSGNCLLIDTLESRASQYSGSDVDAINKHSDLAYIIYTSGSTGVPKGTMIEHQSVIRLVKNSNFVSLDNDVRLLATCSINFDVSVFEIWGTLLNGGQLHVMKLDELMNSAILKRYIRKNDISTMWFTVSWFNQLVSEDITLFEGLRTVIVGGEKLSEVHIKKLRDAMPDVEIINGYGPTENAIFSASYRIKSVSDLSIPIGKPVSNSTVYILDQNNRLVPKGIFGEICVGGDGVSRGYLNNDALTAQKFIKNPFRSNDRLYKTGDFGRWLEDGNIQFFGRKDSQVKIRGFRIELEEIETALLSCDEIDEVAVVVKRDDSNSTAQLVAYVVSEREINAAQLKSKLKQTLPDYMIPASFIGISEMPLTANGKLDHKKLPAVDDADLDNQYSVILPTTPTQIMLAKIWEEILETSGIGINRNFFELGGHSLKAAQLVGRVQRDMNCTIGFRDVFVNPTIESLSAAIGNPGQSNYQQIQVAPNQDSYELSHAQQRLWIINQVGDNNSAYNVFSAYELIGDLDKTALARSFSTLVERHESLRTNFLTVDGKPRQRILNTRDIPLEFIDRTSDDLDESVIKEQILQDGLKPFDLEHEALIRCKVIELGVNKNVFTLTLHHIISDGLSMEILFNELVSLYNTYHSGKDPVLEPLRIQYKDYSTWQNNFLKSSQASAQKDFWTQKFIEPSPALELPADKVRPMVNAYEADLIEFKLDKHLAHFLNETSQKNGATVFMTLQALVKTMLYAYTGQVDITTGTLAAGREHPDLANQVGFYVNTLSIRTILGRNDTFTDVVRKVKDSTLEAFDNQMYPFDLVLADLTAAGAIVKRPFFEVVVTYDKKTRNTNAQELQDITINKYKLDRNICHFDLDFNFIEKEDGIDVFLAYNLDLFVRDRISRMVEHFIETATAVAKNPDDPIHRLIELVSTKSVSRVEVVKPNRKLHEVQFQ
jgi:amino acid adenylation domain-containing protein/FkbM family methyltransferase